MTVEHPGRSEVVSAIASAPTGMTFGQLLLVDAAEVRNEFDKLFAMARLKCGVTWKGYPTPEDIAENKLLTVHLLKNYK